MARSTHALRSATYDMTDAFEVNEFYQDKGWTDGLPIVPPTEERVAECLEAAGLAPGDIIGVERVRQRPMTAEKAAINAVMAGCMPAYMPVVVAVLAGHVPGAIQSAWQHCQHRRQCAVIVVNGPIRTALGHERHARRARQRQSRQCHHWPGHPPGADQCARRRSWPARSLDARACREVYVLHCRG